MNKYNFNIRYIGETTEKFISVRANSLKEAEQEVCSEHHSIGDLTLISIERNEDETYRSALRDPNSEVSK